MSPTGSEMKTKSETTHHLSTAALLLLLLIAAGCEKDIVPQPSADCIGFSPAVWDDSATKGTSVGTGSFPAGTYVGVLGYVCPDGTWAGTETPYYIYNTKLETDGDYASQTDVRYWPISPAKIRFFAYYPYELQSGEGGSPAKVVLSGKNETGFPFLEYTVPESPAGQVDLLGCVTEAINTPGTAVPLQFSHLLTRVGFFAKLDDATPANLTVTVDSLTLDNLYMKAQYDFGEKQWNSLTSKTDYTFLSSAADVGGNSFVNLLGDGEYIMILPQLVNKISLHAVYMVNDSSAGTAVKHRSSLRINDLTEFAAGKSVSFKFNLDPNQDAFLGITIALTDWTANDITTTIN